MVGSIRLCLWGCQTSLEVQCYSLWSVCWTTNLQAEVTNGSKMMKDDDNCEHDFRWWKKSLLVMPSLVHWPVHLSAWKPMVPVGCKFCCLVWQLITFAQISSGMLWICPLANFAQKHKKWQDTAMETATPSMTIAAKFRSFTHSTTIKTSRGQCEVLSSKRSTFAVCCVVTSTLHCIPVGPSNRG